MTCEEVAAVRARAKAAFLTEDSLEASAEAALAATTLAERNAIRAHLDECQECLAKMEELRNQAYAKAPPELVRRIERSAELHATMDAYRSAFDPESGAR
jgi:uncharacterized protein with PIN domain